MTGATVGAALVAASPAGATFPGANGDIAVLSTLVERTTGPCVPSPTRGCSPDDPSVGYRRRLVFVAPGGTIRRAVSLAPDARAFSGSPDGRRLAFAQGESVFVSDLDGGHRRRIARAGDQPAWAPDGQRLAFTDGGAVWVIGVNGRGRRRLTSGRRDFSPAWSPDGRTIAFVRDARLPRPSPCSGRSDLFAVRAAGGRPRLLIRPALRCGMVGWLDWSPGGRRLVVTIGDGSRPGPSPDPGAAGLVGITLLRADGTRLRRLLSSGTAPVWSPDGREIAHFGGDPRCGVGARILCAVSADGRRVRRIVAVRDDQGAGFGPTWLVRRSARRA